MIGNCSVGKMTVGQELTKITPFRLFHNHMTIEPVLEIFGDYNTRVVARLRDVIFEEFASSNHYGLIFTYMWAFDHREDWDYVEHVKSKFGLADKDIYYAELVAPQAIRLQRNCTENRLKNKASKRNIEASNKRLINDDLRYRCESLPGEIPFPNYLRIDTSCLSPEETAAKIKAHFSFPD